MLRFGMPAYLGLDCGGTKTRAMVCDESDNVLHDQSSGPGNFASTPRELLIKHIREAVDGAPLASSACICMAGLLTESDKVEMSQVLSEITGIQQTVAMSDIHASWAATEDEADILVIAGTGANVISENEGRLNKSGGGGPIFGDDGSAASIGRRSLYNTVLSADRHPASDAFWSAVEDQFGTSDPSQVVAAVYRSETPAAKFAKLAGPAGQDAVDGYEYANAAIDDSLRILSEEVERHAKKYVGEIEGLRIVLAGGLWKTHPIYLERFKKAFDKRCTEYKLLERPPVYGAVRLARQLAE